MENGKRWMAAFQLFSSLTRTEMAYKVVVLFVVVAFVVIICLTVMGMVNGDDRIDRVAGHCFNG